MQLPAVEARGGAPGAVATYYDDHKPRTPPPDLPSLLLDSRITYLGMPVRTDPATCCVCHGALAECCATPCASKHSVPITCTYVVSYAVVRAAQLVPAVTELIIAELLYLQYKDRQKPIFLYINSTGTTRADGETVRLHHNDHVRLTILHQHHKLRLACDHLHVSCSGLLVCLYGI